MKPLVSILIVNWNVKDLLDACLSSIEKYTSVPHEIIVVDNASTDGSVEMIRKKYPAITLIDSQKNLGFVGGNNEALKHASSDSHILYLNPDIELLEDAIGPMLEYLESNPKVGVIGCELLNTDRSHQQTIGVFTGLDNLWREYFGREKADDVRRVAPQKTTAVQVVLGACMLCRGSVVRELGGMDTRYFMYLEETDLCKSIHQKGFEIVYFPEVKMVHHSGKSSGYNEESRQRSLYENRRSQYLFFQKHYSFGKTLVAKLLIGGGMLVRIPILALLWILKPAGRKATGLKLKYYSKTIGWLVRKFP
ncbi:MAG: glycosyl transferase family 2 [Patescibacteria group bacterium]|jgi:GT2 family glycosyltransferase|nr:glycosyl transferase family 2 [Patescibacteria group bacterium]